MGPLVGFVFILFLKKRSYLAFCLTIPPEMHASSVLTTTYEPVMLKMHFKMPLCEHMIETARPWTSSHMGTLQ